MDGEVIRLRGLIKTPANILVAAPSQSGKSSLVKEIILNRDELFDCKTMHILYCYKIDQELYSPLKNQTDISFHEGVPTREMLEKISNKKEHVIVVFDDLAHDLLSKENISFTETCFTVLGHHLNISYIMIAQNLFQKNLRHISINVHIFFVCNYIRDINQVFVLARQCFAHKASVFMDIYNDALKSSKNDTLPSYIMLSCHPHSGPIRLFTNILPFQRPIIAYVIN